MRCASPPESVVAATAKRIHTPPAAKQTFSASAIFADAASMAALATSLAQSAGQDAILYAGAATTVGLILTSLLLPITLLQATKYIDGTWTLAVTRADAAGVALADALCARSAIGERPVTLVGYSLGARLALLNASVPNFDDGPYFGDGNVHLLDADWRPGPCDGGLIVGTDSSASSFGKVIRFFDPADAACQSWL